MDYSKILPKLNDCLRHEWTGVAQYAQASFVVSGLWREVYAEVFSEAAKESFGHAQLVGEKISACGGVPTVERNPVKQSSDVTELLEIGLEFEKGAVTHYAEAIEIAEEIGDRALVVFLEDILKEEQEGVDEITLILKGHNAGSVSKKKSDTKAG